MNLQSLPGKRSSWNTPEWLRAIRYNLKALYRRYLRFNIVNFLYTIADFFRYLAEKTETGAIFPCKRENDGTIGRPYWYSEIKIIHKNLKENPDLSRIGNRKEEAN
jgi:hypothetical protein